jgi:hypothetical protein
MPTKLALAALLALLPSLVLAQAPTPRQHSPYAGERSREIKSLSADDIEELRRGGGWGLAKAAELNGVPGPAHLLELKDEIPLDATQIEALEQLFLAMQAAAAHEGERLITQEAALEAAFRGGTVTEASLRAQLDDIAATHGRLRFIHLRTHLATPQLLSRDQIERYNRLRGYATDSCAATPAGHDPVMWRRHMGCD